MSITPPSLSPATPTSPYRLHNQSASSDDFVFPSPPVFPTAKGSVSPNRNTLSRVSMTTDQPSIDQSPSSNRHNFTRTEPINFTRPKSDYSPVHDRVKTNAYLGYSSASSSPSMKKNSPSMKTDANTTSNTLNDVLARYK